MEQESDLLTVQEVAVRLRLVEGRGKGMGGAVRAVHRLRRLHGIEALRVGRKVLFTPDGVEQLLRACTIGPPDRERKAPAHR